MDQPKKKLDEVLFTQVCPKLNIGLRLRAQTWEEHIKPFHPIEDKHIPVVEEAILSCDKQQLIWKKKNQPDRMCIVKQVSEFLPGNRFILISFMQYSESMGVVTSVYPVDELPSKEKGFILI